jgi:6,7-dimethyl-8-ribityllumazine synthase
MAHSGRQEYSENADGLRLVVIAARYNDDIISLMVQGARQRWTELGGDHARLRVERVPGAFELPLAALKFAQSGQVDAVVALGCVIRGDTAHFDFVAGECARGLQQVCLDTGLPVAFGVLTTDTHEQAMERASPNEMNKGAEAVDTAVQMALLLRRV